MTVIPNKPITAKKIAPGKCSIFNETPARAIPTAKPVATEPIIFLVLIFLYELPLAISLISILLKIIKPKNIYHLERSDKETTNSSIEYGTWKNLQIPKTNVITTRVTSILELEMICRYLLTF